MDEAQAAAVSVAAEERVQRLLEEEREYIIGLLQSQINRKAIFESRERHACMTFISKDN